MNRLILSVLFLIPFMIARSDGWRPKEKQIIIEIPDRTHFNKLNTLKISFDFIAPDRVRAYVVPAELDRLEKSGITYEIEIEDLNEYHKDFWNSKDAYHTYQEIIDLADSLVQAFPALCQKIIYGSSLGGRQLAALKISDNVLIDEGEPKVMFDGGIHGDEIGASENVIRFARDILTKYGTDPIVTNLINNREIWLFLMVNPDGRVNMSRYNNNGVDLNRDAPYMWDSWGGSTGPCSQVESKALRDCMYNQSFVVHTSYHSGTEYVSCPWSYRPDQPADWSHIYQLAGVYANTSLYPSIPYGQGYSGMYGINGSTKDSNYGIMGSISWSMEISMSKQPPASQIMLYYNYNYPAMIAMIERAGYGLSGFVTDAITGAPVDAVIKVNNYYPTYTNPALGDYHKYVLPGTYNITVVANGYATQTVTNVVVTANNSSQTNFQLQPQPGHYVYKFSASQIPGNNHADEGLTQAVLGAPDGIFYSLGKNGYCIVDMQYPILDGPGDDVTIHEGGTTPESFSCYAGSTIDGPWVLIGNGTGTTSFDLANAAISETQFIKIVDSGNGSANIPDAGFDLDAVEAIILHALFMADQTVICEGEIIQFTDLSTGNPATWEWLFEGGSPAGSASQHPSVTYLSAGIYDVTLTISDGTDMNSYTAYNYITVNAIPEVPGTPTGPEYINPENTVTSVYETTGSPNATSYIWLLEPEIAGTIVGNGTESTVSWSGFWEGTATIRVKSENNCGQSDFSESLPVYLIITGVQSLPEHGIKVYPNPATGDFRIEALHGSFSGPVTIEIKDYHGVTQFSSNSFISSVNNTLTIQRGNLGKGVYVLVVSGDRFNFIKKLIIQ